MDMDKEFVQGQLKTATTLIAMLDLGVMRHILSESQQMARMYDAIGPILDPTGYRDALYDGRREHADAQREILRHMIAIREEIEKLNTASAQYRSYHEGHSI